MGWELVAPKALIGRKEHLILGLSLTTVFILVFDLFPLESVLNTSDSSLVNLCIVLLIGYLLSGYQKRPPAFFEKTTYFMAWLLATCLDVTELVRPGLLAVSSLSVNVSLIIGVVLVAFLGKKLASYWKKISSRH